MCLSVCVGQKVYATSTWHTPPPRIKAACRSEILVFYKVSYGVLVETCKISKCCTNDKFISKEIKPHCWCKLNKRTTFALAHFRDCWINNRNKHIKQTKLVRAECVRQRNKVAIKLGIISLSLLSPSCLLYLQERVIVGF